MPHQRQAGLLPGAGKKIIAAGAGLVLIALAVFAVRGNKAEQPGQTAPRPGDKVFGMEVREVAAKFLCSCGGCDILELADCTCQTAIQEKELIERELAQGKPEMEVIALVNRRYGKLKREYASLLGEKGGASAIPGAAAGVPPQEGGPAPVSLSLPAGGIAAEKDSLAIVSRFICACGQCGELALADCSCDHPRGAREMKSFIAYQISQKRHTPDEIARAVAYEYGHLRKQTPDRRAAPNRE